MSAQTFRRRMGSTLAVLALVSNAAVLPALAATPAASSATVDPDFIRESIYVPVRDGTRLAVNIYRPVANGRAVEVPLPIVFAFTPYRARYIDKEGKLSQLVDSPVFGLRALVKSGYVVATADVRGKGASFGSRRGFLDQTETHDGHDLIEWLAKKPWSSGKVGITGCSYLGGSAMLVAGTLPPSLRAVFAAATDLDKYSFVRNGGITGQFNTRPDEPPEVDLASVPVDADTDGTMLKAAVAEHARNTPMAALWYGMPYRDDVSPLTKTRFWEEVGPYTHLRALRSPQLAWLLWSNWEDEPTEQMILNAANLKSRIFIGPGSHCVPPKAFDIAGEQKQFFDHYLKGVDNGFDRGPRVSYFSETPGKGVGAGAMVTSATLPSASTVSAGAGSASTSMPGSTANASASSPATAARPVRLRVPELIAAQRSVNASTGVSPIRAIVACSEVERVFIAPA